LPIIPPKPYPNTGLLKAFILGCDPTAFPKEDMDKYKRNEIKAEERIYKPLEYVFGIEGFGADKRYFANILSNLNHLGLKLENLYVQNLMTEYQQYLTYENKKLWMTLVTEDVLNKCRHEFNKQDEYKNVPVFLTSYILYAVLLKPGIIRKSAKELYNPKGEIIIPANINQLHRPLIPLFRNLNYSYSNKKDFFDNVKAWLNK
jgi:hypothetical protein